MSGTALPSYADWDLGTGPVYITGEEGILNESTARSYLLRRFTKDANLSKSLQGGNDIKGTVMFDEESTAEFYLPGAKASPRNPQVITDNAIPWRFLRDHTAHVDKEIDLQVSGMTAEAAFDVYFSVKYAKEMRMWTSKINTMETAMAALPDPNTMEVAGGTDPNSLIVFNNEATNGLLNGYSVIQGLAPATFPKWVPQQGTYAQLPATGAGAGWDLWGAFDDMLIDVHFDTLPGREEYATKSSGKYFITTDKEGRTNYQEGARRSNDNLAQGGHQDPAYSNIKYAGIDIMYWAALDTAAIYDDGSSGFTDQANANAAGPRYFWWNGDWVYPVYHTTKYCVPHPEGYLTHPNQPDTQVLWYDSWYNWRCDSRRRLGIVYPSATLT